MIRLSTSSHKSLSKIASTLTLSAFFALSSQMSTRSHAETTVIKPNVAVQTTFNQGALFPYTILDRALSKTVDSSGNTAYNELKGNVDLDTFIRAVTTADLSAFPVLQVKDTRPDAKPDAKRESRNFEMVFWINAYNAHVLKTISDAWPISNVGEIKNFDSAKTHLVAGTNYSLREMRDKIAKFDARALFALSNGTKGGPLMQPTAYRYVNINSSLERAVQTFVGDARNFTINRIGNKITLSDFYKDMNPYFTTKKNDTKRLEGVRSVLALYSTRGGDRNYFTTNDYVIDFRSSDKSLNVPSR